MTRMQSLYPCKAFGFKTELEDIYGLLEITKQTNTAQSPQNVRLS